MKRRIGNCYVCSKENVTIAKKLYDGSLCVKCNTKRLNAKKEKKEPIGLNGEMGVFLKIWSERPHKSEVSGEDLGNILKPIFFSHLLPKGSYPEYRFNPDNIMLKTAQEHHDWHSCSRIDLVNKDDSWQKVLDMYEELKDRYIQEYK
jgi:hypothetical protein